MCDRQGGCIEPYSQPPSSDPSYVVEDRPLLVTNMPAAVPNTSTLALTNVTFPYSSAGATRRRRSHQSDPGSVKE